MCVHIRKEKTTSVKHDIDTTSVSLRLLLLLLPSTNTTQHTADESANSLVYTSERAPHPAQEVTAPKFAHAITQSTSDPSDRRPGAFPNSSHDIAEWSPDSTPHSSDRAVDGVTEPL